MQILAKIFPISNVGDCKYVNCEIKVNLLNNFFKRSIKFFENPSCNSDCSLQYKKLSIVEIDKLKIASIVI